MGFVVFHSIHILGGVVMRNPKVSAIVLAHNNCEDTIECLSSLTKVDYSDLLIWLVDNGSQDGTAEKVAEKFTSVRIIQTGRNLGVAGGYNAGIVPALECGSEYIFILNNDVIVEKDTLINLIKEALKDNIFGILMPKILYYENRMRIWSAGARYRRFPPSIVMIGLNCIDGPKYNIPRNLEYAPTCGLLISRDVFEKIGLFDEGYFFFYDDWDYSIRARKAGYIIRYVPSARLYHKVSRTIGATKQTLGFWRIWGKSGGRFYRRHGSWLSALIHLGYLALREGTKNGLAPMIQFVVGAYEGYYQK